MTNERMKWLEHTCEAAFPLALEPFFPGDAVVAQVREELRREAQRLARSRRALAPLRWAASAAAAVALMGAFASPIGSPHGTAPLAASADAETLRDFLGATAQSTAALQRLIADDWLTLDAENPDVDLDAINKAFNRLRNVGA